MSMITINKTLTTAIVAIPWVIGIVLAKGFWSTTFALFIPLWAWYLTAEKWLMVNGWLS